MMNYVGVAAPGGGGGIVAGPIVSPVGVNSVDWAIPPAVRRLTLLSSDFDSFSTGHIRFGTSAGMLTTGYASTAVYVGQTTTFQPMNSTLGMQGMQVPQSDIESGFCMTFHRSVLNRWNFTGQSLYGSDGRYIFLTAGNVQLPGELSTFRYASGFAIDEGSLQLLWEL